MASTIYSKAGTDAAIAAAVDAIQAPSTGTGGSVTSVNGQTGAIVLDAADVGADPAGTAQGLVDDLVIPDPDLSDYVQTTDPRLMDARPPTTHTHTPDDLGAGTPAAGQYLDGDGTWKALPAGGGASLPAGTLTGDLLIWDGTGWVPDSPQPATASQIAFIPAGTISATNVQAAIEGIGAGGGGGGSAAKIDTYDAPATAGQQATYTWAKPAGAKVVNLLWVSGGGGGGSGRRGAAATARWGGGGGSPGVWGSLDVPASTLDATLTVKVGAGGAGGVAVTADDTSGNNGGNGGITQILDGAGIIVTTEGGKGGSGGTATAGAGGAGGLWGHFWPVNTPSGGAGGNPNGIDAGTLNQGYNPPGGGGGGGISAADVSGWGGAGSIMRSASRLGGFSAPAKGGEAQGYKARQTAEDGVTATGYGGGGGGGGAALNGTASGAGGRGGDGVVIITTYF